jgi:G:T-mismatch repair DNA endonuclease (very short patch repair protein)
MAELLQRKWRVLTVWECALRGRDEDYRQAVYDAVADWLRGNNEQLELDSSLGAEDDG